MSLAINLILISAFGWFFAAAVAGWHGDRFPAEFPLLFIIIGMLRLVFALVVIFQDGSAAEFGATVVLSSMVLLPLAFLAYLFHIYPIQEPPSKPRTLGNGSLRSFYRAIRRRIRQVFNK